jgi:hypothetical protein
MTVSSSDEVRITIKQVWETQQIQGKALTDISGKLDRLLDSHDRVDEKVRDHEIRIRILEQKVWALPSIATIISIGGLLWQVLTK